MYFHLIPHLVRGEGDLQQLHHPVKQAVDDLEAGRLVVEDSRQVSLVPRSNFGGKILGKVSSKINCILTVF